VFRPTTRHRVAVAGWQLYQSMRNDSAVRTVPVAMWGWQWLVVFGHIDTVTVENSENEQQKKKKLYVWGSGGMESGSGWVAVTPIDAE
jgi:hypothetical protein